MVAFYRRDNLIQFSRSGVVDGGEYFDVVTEVNVFIRYIYVGYDELGPEIYRNVNDILRLIASVPVLILCLNCKLICLLLKILK